MKNLFRFTRRYSESAWEPDDEGGLYRLFYYRYLTVRFQPYWLKFSYRKWRYDGMPHRHLTLGWLHVHWGRDYEPEQYAST